MNETIRTLTNRRSVRKYKKAQICDEDLHLILQAGMNAASAKGIQPCTIVVVQNPDTLGRLTAMNAKIKGTATDPLYGAPTALVVLADMEKSPNAWSDGCLILGNLMNAAAALHLGSCWINRAREEFELPRRKVFTSRMGPSGTLSRRRPLYRRIRRRAGAGCVSAKRQFHQVYPLIQRKSSYRSDGGSFFLQAGQYP